MMKGYIHSTWLFSTPSFFTIYVGNHSMSVCFTASFFRDCIVFHRMNEKFIYIVFLIIV